MFARRSSTASSVRCRRRGLVTRSRSARSVAVIDYADDAIDWHLADADDAARTAAHEIVTEWRWHNHLPFNQAIRQTRPD